MMTRLQIFGMLSFLAALWIYLFFMWFFGMMSYCSGCPLYEKATSAISFISLIVFGIGVLGRSGDYFIGTRWNHTWTVIGIIAWGSFALLHVMFVVRWFVSWQGATS